MRGELSSYRALLPALSDSADVDKVALWLPGDDERFVTVKACGRLRLQAARPEGCSHAEAHGCSPCRSMNCLTPSGFAASQASSAGRYDWRNCSSRIAASSWPALANACMRCSPGSLKRLPRFASSSSAMVKAMRQDASSMS